MASLQTAVSQLKRELSANYGETSQTVSKIIKRCNDQDGNIHKINELSQRISSLADKNLDTRLSQIEEINLTNNFPKSLK